MAQRAGEIEDERAPLRHWHALTPEEALGAVGAGSDGLTAREARSRLEHFGPNPVKSVCQWFNVLHCRSERRSALAIGVVGTLVLWVEEARKFVVRRRERRIALVASA